MPALFQISRRVLLLAAAAVLAGPAGAQTMPIAESRQAEPLRLGSAPVAVTLAAAQPLRARLQAPRAGEQFYLLLQQVRAEAAVDAVYEIYLDLPAATQPSRDSRHYVGDLNFFDAESGRRSASFNITALLAELQRSGALGDAPTVTLVPNGQPSAEARPSIGKIQIVAAAR